MELETSSRNSTWEGEGKSFTSVLIASCGPNERRKRKGGEGGERGREEW